MRNGSMVFRTFEPSMEVELRNNLALNAELYCLQDPDLLRLPFDMRLENNLFRYGWHVKGSVR